MPLYGYARVSTHDQDTQLQEAALRQAGAAVIVSETRSGAKDRPRLEQLVGQLQAGDVLMVYKVDRLARSLSELLRLLQTVSDRGAAFRSLTEPIETASPAGRMLVQLLGAFAEFERAIIRERCAAGIVMARQKGVRFGRPPALSAGQRARVATMASEGNSLAGIARAMGCSRDTVARVLGRKP